MINAEIKAGIIALSVGYSTAEHMERAIAEIKKEMKESVAYIHDIANGCDEAEWQEITDFAKLHGVTL